jgi:hypothetical protein
MLYTPRGRNGGLKKTDADTTLKNRGISERSLDLSEFNCGQGFFLPLSKQIVHQEPQIFSSKHCLKSALDLKTEGVTGDWSKVCNYELHNL